MGLGAGAAGEEEDKIAGLHVKADVLLKQVEGMDDMDGCLDRIEKMIMEREEPDGQKYSQFRNRV